MNDASIVCSILTRDGQSRVQSAIESFRRYFPQNPVHVFVDSETTDDSFSFAKELGCVVATFQRTTFDVARNMQLAEATACGASWVLILDDDEHFCVRDLQWLTSNLKNGFGCSAVVGYLARNNWTSYERQQLVDVGMDLQPRLLRTNAGTVWGRAVHEIVQTPGVVHHLNPAEVTLDHFAYAIRNKMSERTVLYARTAAAHVIASLPRDILTFTGVGVEQLHPRLAEGPSRMCAIWNERRPGVSPGAPNADLLSFYGREVEDRYLWDLAAWHLSDPRVRAWVECIALSTGGRRVLDFGAGIGTYTLALALGHIQVSAVDINPINVRFIQHRAESLICSSNIDYHAHGLYTAAVCIDVFEHLDDPAATVRYLHSLISPGGRLLCTWTFDNAGGVHPFHLTDDAKVQAFHDELARLFSVLFVVEGLHVLVRKETPNV